MTNTNNVTPIAKSKMAQAIALFKEIHEAGYKLNGATQRAEFIKRAEAEIVDPKTGLVSCSKNCAATYFQNISNKENKGESLYKYNKYKGKKAKKSDVAAAEDKVIKALPAPVQERWVVIDAEGGQVGSYKTRNEAQTMAKNNPGFKWADGEKKTA